VVGCIKLGYEYDAAIGSRIATFFHQCIANILTNTFSLLAIIIAQSMVLKASF